jgi:hypothetical protein
MGRVLRIVRFKDNNVVKKLELFADPPKETNFPQEGRFLIVIEDEKGRHSFSLTMAEATLLYERLGYVIQDLSRLYIEAEEKARREYMSKKQDIEESIEFEDEEE